ncbi:MAG: GTPase [Bdellovibrionales bacterium CG10_big_fil_rev_8_21_14_0_10_45_34]|nr:MAG: GTPase [Bdellovibrionales bacterium CG10_big_fil_rev_8_21_14_0_10_45_34]
MKLVCVYAVDGGLWNSVLGVAHKMISPKTYGCTLCSLTHGALSEKKQWKQFREKLGTEMEFLHKDEFTARYRHVDSLLPAVFLDNSDQLQPLIDCEEIKECKDVETFIKLITSRLGSECKLAKR